MRVIGLLAHASPPSHVCDHRVCMREALRPALKVDACELDAFLFAYTSLVDAMDGKRMDAKPN